MRTSNVLALLALTAMAASPLACFYPDYTFDETGSGGSGASGNPSSGPSSGGSGAVGGGGAGVGGNLGEECGNGVDDDEDQQVDCADGECTDFVCTPPVPADWTGYFALYDGAAPDPGCPAGYPSTTNDYVGNAGLQAPAAECSACTCAAPTGQTCAKPTGIIVQDDVCAGSPFCSSGGAGLPLGPADNTCFIDVFADNSVTCGPDADLNCTTGTSPCNVAASVPPALATGGTCNPQGGVATKPPITWARIGHACGDPALTGAGCNGNQVCLPRAGGDFEPGVCIMHTGTEACPPGSFTEQHVFYEGTTDDRDCNDCACGSAVGGECPATVTLYSSNDCQAATLIASIPAGDCANLAANPEARGRKLSPLGAAAGGSCPASGGDATGDVEPITATTFCCTP
jgi:hypothetical protein